MIINFKALTFALAIFMLLFCETSQFTREDLINSRWRYFKGGHYLRFMNFEADGTIALNNHFHEKFWTLDQMRVTLLNSNR